MASTLDETTPDETQPAHENGRNVAAIVGQNLKRLRKSRGYSLERLAELSGVSRAMLGQIETYKSVPTVSLLWKIADALGVSVASLVSVEDRSSIVLLRRDQTAVYASRTGLCHKRALFDLKHPSQAEIYELALEAGTTEEFAPHPEGGRLTLVVMRGTLAVSVGNAEPIDVIAGDTLIFDGGSPHAIINSADTTAIALSILCLGPVAP